MASDLFGARPWRRKYVWLGSLAAVLAAGAFLSLLVLGYPQFRGQRPLLSEDEAAVLGLINDYRLQHGLSALKISPTLTAAAKWMSEDIAKHDYLGHTDSLGRETVQRMADFGYTPTDTWGLPQTEQWNEIISGYDTPETYFGMWRNPHGNTNAIMLTDDFVVAGIGKAKAHNPQSRYMWYWTVDFGNYDDPQAISLTPSPTRE